MSELLDMEGAATTTEIDSLRDEFAQIVEGELDENELDTIVVIMGRCSQPVQLETEIGELVQQRVQALDICNQGLGKVVKARVLRRECTEKPRSAATQQVTVEAEAIDGQTSEPSRTIELPPHMGDAINGEGKTVEERTPKPSRMVAAAIQDRDIKAGLLAAGKDIPAAKEVLLLPSLKAMIRVDPETGKKYYVGAELPWIGERTRQTDGAHVEALAGIENVIGIKLGPGITAEQVREYQEILNPDGIPGKLVFMLRMGLDHMDELNSTLAAIKEHAPKSMLMYDVHGSTTTDKSGNKIRNISSIIKEIHLVAQACRDAEMKLHGLHIETTMELSDDGQGKERLECVDYEGQVPADRPGVDPQANARQTMYLLGAVANTMALAA